MAVGETNAQIADRPRNHRARGEVPPRLDLPQARRAQPDDGGVGLPDRRATGGDRNGYRWISADSSKSCGASSCSSRRPGARHRASRCSRSSSVGSAGGSKLEKHETWLSASTLLVTQAGFPWGRAILDEMCRRRQRAAGKDEIVPRFGDPGRYSGLAALYAELAKGDAVQAKVKGIRARRVLRGEVVRCRARACAADDLHQGLRAVAECRDRRSPTAPARRSSTTSNAAGREPDRDDKRVEVTVTQRRDHAESSRSARWSGRSSCFLLISHGLPRARLRAREPAAAAAARARGRGGIRRPAGARAAGARADPARRSA